MSNERTIYDFAEFVASVSEQLGPTAAHRLGVLAASLSALPDGPQRHFALLALQDLTSELSDMAEELEDWMKKARRQKEGELDIAWDETEPTVGDPRPS